MKERHMGMICIAVLILSSIQFGVLLADGKINVGTVILMLIAGMILGGIVWDKR